VDFILEKVNKYGLKAIQLHGKESIDLCRELSERIKPDVEIIKVFSIDDTFGFSRVKEYEDVCDFFLFDTKGKEKGGNGITFNWELLKKYNSSKPYFLSGGIGLTEEEQIKDFLNSDHSKYCVAIDVNSRFEEQPGFKNIKELELLIKNLNR
jgi:phosphoribosylanthranilate isomerase